ncbi:MAG: HAD family phosphatase [Chthoniobacterales bacterium]
MIFLKGYPKAILFDYDGVLASTPEYNYLAWHAAFSPEGVDITRRQYFLMEGRGPLLISRMLCQVHGVSSEKDLEIMDRKEKFMRKIAGQASIYPGIPELLHTLYQGGVRLALVTGASKIRVEQFLPKEIHKLFTAVITSDDVRRTKPDPEPYLTAAAILCVSPEDSLVVENAPLGIESAKKGGFPCVALTTTLEAADLQQAVAVFNDHIALSTFLLKDFHPLSQS